MILISLNETKVMANPRMAKLLADPGLTNVWNGSQAEISANLRYAFTLQIGSVSHEIVPSPSRLDPMRDGGEYQVNLRLDEAFEIDDAVFQSLTSFGAEGQFILKLLDYVQTGVVEVRQSVMSATPLTTKQILTYTAP